MISICTINDADRRAVSSSLILMAVGTTANRWIPATDRTGVWIEDDQTGQGGGYIILIEAVYLATLLILKYMLSEKSCRKVTYKKHFFIRNVC